MSTRSASGTASVADTDFRPPKLHLPTLRIWNALSPSLLYAMRDVVSVDIHPADIARFHTMRHLRLLITPNHPTNDDPALIFELAKAVGMPFHYLASRETFDNLGGLWGWLIQRLGAYSVVRGTSDRESFRMTRSLLAAPEGKVVIFPEGEVYSQNDSLLPFQSGVAQMAFWALEDLRKSGDLESDISLLPVAVRYCFVEDMADKIEAALARLETAFGLTHHREDMHYTRLRRIGVSLLEAMESEYGIKKPKGNSPDPDHDLTPRMNAMKSLLLDRAAALIGVTLSEEATLPERMRTLMNSIYAVTREEPTEPRTPYRERLHRQQARRVRPLMFDLNRVANWIAVEDNYVRHSPTPERMADNIRRLEVEAFGEVELRGRRRAIVRLGEPIGLSAQYDAYRADKRATVARLTDELEVAVQEALNSSACGKIG